MLPLPGPPALKLHPTTAAPARGRVRKVEGRVADEFVIGGSRTAPVLSTLS
jgi:hypothetical protein